MISGADTLAELKILELRKGNFMPSIQRVLSRPG